MRNHDRYGVEVLPQLCVLAVESSLGDPVIGGVVVREGNNPGSIKWRPRSTSNYRWWDLSVGESMEGERPGTGPWMKFPTPDIGMDAWGLFLALGGYVELLNAHRWRAFAERYFSAVIPGFEQYVLDLERFYALFDARFVDGGF